MCIGIPMQVRAIAPGHALCQGRAPGQQQRINTALVGPLQHGDWVLVFLDSAREVISPQRAAEVNATLDLLEAVLQGDDPHQSERFSVGFALPSAMSQTDMAALCGGAPQPLNPLETP